MCISLVPIMPNHTDVHTNAMHTQVSHAHSLALVIRGLPVAACALMVGAHPDDEDSALLAELALRHGLRTVYLSLTRGEGGQNRLGPETGPALGILRTGELLASRRYDGAEQLLAPYIDFGYAKRAQDVFARWGREHMVATVVQAMREVQPDLVISVWTGTKADGHGHHQACGIVTHEAFDRAADPAAFPEQVQAGLVPWQSRRLLVRVREPSQWREGDVHTDVGRWDPILGRSCFEVAMQGRSLHRSQNMGALQPKGSQIVTYRVAAGLPVRDEPDATLLTDLPLRLDAWTRTLLRGHRPAVLEATETATRLIDQFWASYHPQHPETEAPLLLQALRALRRARRELEHPDNGGLPQQSPDVRGVRQRLQAHTPRVVSAWAQACGIALEVLAHTAEVVAGGTFEVEAELFMRGETPATLHAFQVTVQPGWRAECLTEPEYPLQLHAGSTVSARFRVHVPQDEDTAIAATVLPWLHVPPEGYLYRFPGPLPSLAPCAPPLLTVQASLHADDLTIPIVAPLVYRELSPGFGEVRQRVRVRPAVTVDVAPELIVLPTHTTDAPVATVRLHAQASAQGRLVLGSTMNGQHNTHALGELNLETMGLHTVRQELPIDLDFQGRRTFRLAWEHQQASHTGSTASPSYQRSIQDIRYPHIEPSYLLVPTQLAVSVVSAEVAPNLTIGYVPGTGDGVPQALAALGIAVETLDNGRLQFADLAQFDAIVVGVRAVETRPIVAANRERLWQYARAGGTIIMQYQRPREDGPSRFIPFPEVSMPRPVPRVSNHKAPVHLLVPDDPLLSFPNRLDANDFADWVHERGLYFLRTWPQEMRPLLECADDGESPQRGGLLHARLGQGHYVYCAYALFRQLPAGVAGAYRLLANLVSLPQSSRGATR